MAANTISEEERGLFAAETRKVDLDVARESINFEEEKKLNQYVTTLDFRNGYLLFNDVVTDESVAGWQETLRRFSRMWPARPIVIELNTPGGDVIEGFGLIDSIETLKQSGHHVTIKVRGLAASFGLVLLQAADWRVMGKQSWLMFHSASFEVRGETFKVEDNLAFTKRLEGKIVDVLSDRTGQPSKYFLDLFKKRKDIFFDSKEALALGLVDEIG